MSDRNDLQIAHSERNDRRLTVLLYIGVGTMILIILFALIATPAILTGASNAEEVKKGTDLASCRIQFSAAVSDAQAALIEAKARLDVNTNEALRAATVEPDPQRLVALIDAAPGLEADVTAAIGVSADKRAEYRVAVERALHDPDGFLAACRAR